MPIVRYECDANATHVRHVWCIYTVCSGVYAVNITTNVAIAVAITYTMHLHTWMPCGSLSY